MEKLIAFDLYRKNDLGGHTMAFRKPVVGDEVYLAADVDALVTIVRQMIEADARGDYGVLQGLVHEASQSLMVRESQ